jgi:hypothetical protein
VTINRLTRPEYDLVCQAWCYVGIANDNWQPWGGWLSSAAGRQWQAMVRKLKEAPES